MNNLFKERMRHNTNVLKNDLEKIKKQDEIYNDFMDTVPGLIDDVEAEKL